MKRKLIITLLALCAALSLATPSLAETDAGFVSDQSGLLSESQRSELEQRAVALADTYGCGVYVVTVDDYTDYSGESVYEAAKTLFTDGGLGVGDGANGFLLLLSMSDRDYSLIAHGDIGNAALTDYGRDVMEDGFLGYFADNDWYGGFTSYMDTAERVLGMYAQGEPLDVDTDPANDGMEVFGSLIFIFGVSFGIAGIVCFIMSLVMKSVSKASAAGEYQKNDMVDIRVSEDRYLYTTTTRTRIERESSGGTTIDSDGFSGSSGKF